jgi:hypothetical protein
MSTDRSDSVYRYWLEASQKFDYFVTGVCFALISYLAGTLKPGTIGLNSNTLLLVSILCLLGAAIAGLRRIEAHVTSLSLMHQRLYSEEKAGTLVSAASEGRSLINTKTGDVFGSDAAMLEALGVKKSIPNIEQNLNKWARLSMRRYKWRNRLLLVGLGGVILSRVVAGYGL